jgi:hypothetical protein
MPRNLKFRLRLGRLLAGTLLLAPGCWTAFASDDIPTGFQSERYEPVWVRNPFTLVTPVIEHLQPKFFDKFILTSWLNDGGKDVVYVQNTDTNELEKVTKEPNGHHLRLIEIRRDPDPAKAEVVLSNGKDQGSVRFRTDIGTSVGQNQVGAAAPGGVVPNPATQQPVQPGAYRQPQRFRNGQPGPGARLPAQATQQQPVPQLPQTDATTTMSAPRASEVRRKRITAPPAAEQPVGGQAPVQNVPTMPQTQ